ncbi:MAG: S8 family serine peptidase [Candidatus Kapabacteria bacterium]|nr:S8 family serine peptidase [Candidatus Kapabacteria bacterium]
MSFHTMRIAIVALSLPFCAAVAGTQTQWDYRVQGVIPVVLPEVTTATYTRPPVVIRIQRVPPEWYEPGRIAFKLRDHLSAQQLPAAVQQVLGQFGYRTAQPLMRMEKGSTSTETGIGLERVFIATFDPGFDPFDVAAALAELPTIEYATPLYVRRTFLQPNDPQFSLQTALQRLQLPAAWDVTTGSPTTTIAIIDSGTDYEHEDLAANLWTNPGETGLDSQGRDKRTNGVDDDGNGKVDDWRGWDFIGNVTRTEYIAGTVREDNDPKIRAATVPAEMQHGTYTAGAAAAVTNNGRGIASPGFQCRFIPIKCGSDDQSLAGTVLRGYEAILYAARLGAHIINCSWGGPASSPLEQQVIDQARALGSFIVVAAGNESLNLDQSPSYPASYRGVFTVGASTLSDGVASFSNYGSAVAAYAPGVSIRTTGVNNTYTTVEGTSFATPLASGIAALVRTLHPDWTADQIAAQLRYSSDRLVGVSDANRPLYYGRLNAQRALQANRSFTAGMRFPGVQVVNVQLEGSTVIASRSTYRLLITVKNLLAPATTVQLTLSASANATVGNTTLTTTQLGTLEERTLTTTLQLAEPVYFFDGSVQLRITIVADGIVEYSATEIPISLPTSNVYTRLATGLSHTFTAIATRGLSGVWAVGRTTSGRAIVFRSTGNTLDSTSISGVPTTLGIASNTIICVGTGNGIIWRTSNGGNSWSSQSVTSFTPSVQGIIFFDASQGICIGQPLGGTWRIGRTTDAGVSWQGAETLPAPLSGEQTTHAAITTIGDTVWIGTTQGRILRSTNRGATWSSAQVATGISVTSLTFANGTVGYCLARPTSGQERYTVFRTLDGGITWTPVGATFSSPAPLPRVLYAPLRSRFVFAICAGSQVLRSNDSASTWEPILTGNGGTVTAAFGSVSGQFATLLMAGQSIASLRVSIADDRPIARITPNDTLDFGHVRVDSTVEADLIVANTGNAALQVTAATIEPIFAQTGEFSVRSLLPLTLQPNTSHTLTIRFRPATVGLRRATLRIQTNADPAERLIVLQGYGETASGVEISTPALACSLYSAALLLTVDCPAAEKLWLWDVQGKLLAMYEFSPANRQPLQLDVSALLPGAYAYQILTNANTYFCGVLLIMP